ncbi:MAG: processive 1,2-diacylglycerol beta-glucosyltransferase [Solirubrobacteraceae bacterium]|nr:processive 1,2-diacylglycerol beta-glucosyltransferase [Solirubrobacteraceae bacterium]
MPGALVLTASIGAGHDVPAERLARDLRARGIEVHVADGVAAMGGLIEKTIAGATAYETPFGNRLFDAQHLVGIRFPPGRRLSGRLLQTLGARGLLALVVAHRPDVIVSTYPGTTELLGRLRRAGRLQIPTVAAITDLASLQMWAHPGIDLHLMTHPESMREVRAIAGRGADIVAVRGFNPAGFEQPPSRATARAALGLPATGSVVLISGGGWGVGDVAGAIGVALRAGVDRVLVLCGTNAELREQVPDDPRVRAFGFTERMPELLSAADVLIHSTAGLTVLEALICGTRVISYGWARGHIRLNNIAFRRSNLAQVARDLTELEMMLATALRAPAAPLVGWFALPAATDVLLDRFPVLKQAA